MKIGVLTYHFVYNFGANLQALSTLEYLKKNGFDPLIINWIPLDTEEKYKKNTPIQQAEAHKQFFQDYFSSSEICRNDDDILKVIRDYNIKTIIIGSDAVLQHHTFLTRLKLRKKGIVIDKKPLSSVLFPSPYWGSFIEELDGDISVSILSASSQNARYKFFKGRLRKKMSIALKSFKIITVRDIWTMKMVQYLTKGEITPAITPDPVFGFNQNVTKQISSEEIRNKFLLPEKYLLVSFRTSDAVSFSWLENIKKLAEEKGYTCVALTMPEGISFKHPFSNEIIPPLSPIEWYCLIKHSSGYIGENMHPIVVALHNSVPFFAFDSYGIRKFKYFVNEKSSKIHDILSFSGFLSNKRNILSRGYKAPSPEFVFKCIYSFDHSKCTTFSIEQHKRYEDAMKLLTPGKMK